MKEFFSAFIAGRKLSNSETWKKRQVAVSLIMSILAFVLYAVKAMGYNIELSEEDRHAISEVFYILVVFFSVFGAGATVATTTSIGMPSKTIDTGTGGNVGDTDNSASGRASEDGQVSMDASTDTGTSSYMSYLDDNQKG